jgi:hypothetical protein
MSASVSTRPVAISRGIFLALLIPQWDSSLPTPSLRGLWPEPRAIERFLTSASFAVNVLPGRSRVQARTVMNASVIRFRIMQAGRLRLQHLQFQDIKSFCCSQLYTGRRESSKHRYHCHQTTRQLVRSTAVDMSTQIDIKHTLQVQYVDESNFPNWTTPFINAVGLLEELEELEVDPNDLSNWIPPESRREGEGSRAGPTATEREMERIGEEVVTNLESVSIDDNSSRLLSEFHSRGRPSNSVTERSLFPSYGLPTFTSKSKTGPRQDHPR